METPKHLDPTIVTANGTIIHTGKPFDGLVVVSGDDKKPVISFDEVTGDDEVVHVFCKFAPGAAFGKLNTDFGPGAATIVGSRGINNTHEILIRKDEHEPLTKGA